MSIRTVALFGATGKAGSQILSTLLTAGYTVRALARTPAQFMVSELAERRYVRQAPFVRG